MLTFLFFHDFNGHRRDMICYLHNEIRAISTMKVSKTRVITETLCVYDLATSFNRRPVSRAATVMLSIELLV